MRWVTFDCYGTLADWRGGMAAALRPLAGEATDRLMTAYYDHELEVEHESPGMRYREIFADVGPSLSALRDAGWSLAILTNCDDDLIAQTVERMPVAFDEIVTAEQV